MGFPHPTPHDQLTACQQTSNDQMLSSLDRRRPNKILERTMERFWRLSDWLGPSDWLHKSGYRKRFESWVPTAKVHVQPQKLLKDRGSAVEFSNLKEQYCETFPNNSARKYYQHFCIKIKQLIQKIQILFIKVYTWNLHNWQSRQIKYMLFFNEI